MKKNIFNDPVSRNIWYLSLLVFVISLQVLILVVFIYQFVPMTMDPITKGVPTTLLQFFKPNRNHFFYHVFVFAAIIGQAGGLYLYRKQLRSPEMAARIQQVLIGAAFLVLWQLFAVFKILQYDDPQWARNLLYAGFAAALLSAIFWPEVMRGFKLARGRLKGDIPKGLLRMADGGIIFLLLLAIAIPDTQKALVRMAFADNDLHFDQWLMAPLWAYHKGLVPALQVFDPLNWGALVIVHVLAGFMGGVTYGHVIVVLVFLAIAYYSAFYYLLRSWLGVLPAAFGVMLAVKLQMFHAGINPFIWIYPGQSILRHLFDVVVFFCFLLFSRGQGEIFLWLAAGAVGISLSLVFDTGVYLIAALYAYAAVLMAFKDTRCSLCPSPKLWRKILGLAILPWLLMFIMLVLCFGPGAFHRDFWVNSFRDIPRWLKGEDAISIYSCLKDRNFYAFFASFFPPLMYVIGMTATISMVWLRRWTTEKLLIIPLSIYGLGVYAHFLWHGTINYYYLVPLPLAGCLCFWLTQALRTLSNERRRIAQLILVLVGIIGLFTNFFFTYYPNVLNLAGENWSQEKMAYQANYNFSRDADFIRDGTSSDQRVALISGFETQLLLQADRAPFFYNDLPLVNAGELEHLLAQMDERKPEEVFIDKRFFGVAGNDNIKVLMDYLKAHYQYTGHQSDSLVLLKRNHG